MTRFELYRYQILPLDRFFQGDLVSGISSIEELLARKNELFASVVNDLGAFRSGRTETITKKLAAQEDFFLFKIAANRSIHRETKEFTDEYLDNWPSILVGIWNRPEFSWLQSRSAPLRLHLLAWWHA